MPATSSASSSTSSERDERVFIAAFGIMDSHQDGEAIAAFMRVRTILRRHGGGFRRLLERSHEAEQLNEELGRQNAQLLRENAALRARDSRPASSPSRTDDRGPFVMPAVPEFRHWDIGLIGIIAIATNYGLLGFTASLMLTAAILICAAFANWFSPIRFFAGVILGLTALGLVMFNRSASAAAPTLAVDPPAATAPASTDHAAADAPPSSQTFVDTAAARQTFADSRPPRRTFVEPRSPQREAPRTHCGPYRLPPGVICSRSTSWRRNFLPDFGRPLSMRYD
jgi:hypothetical protein